MTNINMGTNNLIVVGVLTSWEDAQEMRDIIATSTVGCRFRKLIKRK
jgi:hypothetical protein